MDNIITDVWIELDFDIWFSVYCEPYGMPEIRPDKHI